MTSTTRPSRVTAKRPSTPDKIIAAGLATVTCVGLVGLIGARTVSANTADDGSSTQPQEALGTASPTTSSGLTQSDLDSYAAQLAAERVRLDTYRAKLIKAGKQLQRQAARQALQTAGEPATNKPATTAPKPIAKPVPKPAQRPVARPAPQQQAAPAPQSNTKGS